MRPKPNRGRCVLALFALGIFGLIYFNSNNPIGHRGIRHDNASAAAMGGNDPPGSQQPSILFTCPDGRIGLHLVHTRFLVGQASATPLFVASRLALMRTFLVPSLTAQSTKNFVFYSSYDPELNPSAAQAFQDAVSSITAAHKIALKERLPADSKWAGGNWANLNFSAATDHLLDIEPRVKDVDIFITSRIDSDDAAHYDTVAAFQQYACSGTDLGTDGRSSRGGKQPPSVRLAYPQNGQLWFPSMEDHYGTAGIWKTGKKVDDLYRVMSIMPTMVLTGREFIKRCAGKLNVYAMPHYQPEVLETLKVDGCKFKFSARKDIFYWKPPEKEIGYLYVRTPSSWTHEKGDLKYYTRPADMDVLQRSLGLSPAAIAGANILFCGFQKEDPELLAGKGSTSIE